MNLLSYYVFIRPVPDARAIVSTITVEKYRRNKASF